jgi:ubiquitin-protein ligase
MTENTWDRRLRNDYRLIQEYLQHSSHIALDAVDGDPPDYYQVCFDTCGIVRLENGEPVYGRKHRVEIILPPEYPRNGPLLRYLTPIFHPNFYPDGDICVSAWIPGRPLIEVIKQLDHMIAYRNFDTHKISWGLQIAPNRDAALWAEQHPDLIPINQDRFCKA